MLLHLKPSQNCSHIKTKLVWIHISSWSFDWFMYISS